MKRLLLTIFAAAITAAWAIPASAGDVSLSGSYRLRTEYQNNKTDFDGNANDHIDMWGQRVRLTAKASPTDDTTVKITIQDQRNWGGAQATGGGPGLTDAGANTLDLHESYVQINDVAGLPISIKAGRQELVYGDQRLVGAFGWHNNARSFDALKGTYSSDAVDVDFFTSKINEGANVGRDQNFRGIYATVKTIPNNSLDVYVLSLVDGNIGGTSAFNKSATGNTSLGGSIIIKPQTLTTYGVRLKGSAVGVNYTVEVPFQTGKVETYMNNYKYSGRAFAVKANYLVPNTPKLKVGVEYDKASGDSDGTDNKIKTFMNLFPTNHGHYGYADHQGWRNMAAWNVNASVQAMPKLNLGVSYWDFSLDKKEDAWYGAGNWLTTPTGIRAASTTNTSKDLGTEIDLTAKYKYNSAVSLMAGVSRFTPGAFIKNQLGAGTSKEDADFGYVQLLAKF